MTHMTATVALWLGFVHTANTANIANIANTATRTSDRRQITG